MKLFSILKKNYPFLLFLFCCAAFILFFNHPINNLLNTLLVKPIISEFYNTPISNIVLIILSIGIAIWLIIYGETKFLLSLALLTLFFYCLTFYSGYWNFQHSKLFPGMLNWNFIVLSLTIPALKIIKLKTPVSENQHNEGFVEDRPINSISTDNFKRSVVAKEIADKISITQNLNSFAIGFLGEYGSGKTSFINLIKIYLNKDKTKILNFNPWSSEKSSNIQRDFFDQLAAKLYNLNPKISNLIIDYSRKLSRIDNSIEKSINQLYFVSNFLKSKSYSDDFEKINTLLKTCDKKIVVTIDDLDRLYNDEVMEVLRLIRNTANFTNIVYLVAYERSYINEAIKSINSNVDSSYLDKIIQLEIPLPKRENDDLLDLLKDHLIQFITKEHIDAFESNIVSTGFKNEYNFSFKGVFRQSRDVIRFINNFKITYSLLGAEVIFESLFVLELLKFRFPLIYDRLFEHRDDFVHESIARSSHDKFYELRTYKEEIDKKNTKDTLIITKILRNEKYYNESDILLIDGLLNNLFFKFDRSKEAKNSIIYPMFFERYFRYRLSKTDISEKSFQAAKSNGLQGFKEYVDECVEKKSLNEVSIRIFQENPDNNVDYELKVESLFYVGYKFSEEKKKSSFDYRALIDVLWNYNNEISRKFYGNDKNKFKAFIEKVFDQAPFPYIFNHELLYHVKTVQKDIDISLSKDEITKLQVQYFKDYVNKNGLNDDAVWMFWWTKYKEFIPLPDNPSQGHEYWHFEKDIIPVILKFLEIYNPIHFLKYSIGYDFREKDQYYIYKEILEIFNNPDDMKEVIIKNTLLKDDVKNEFTIFFDMCKTKAFNEYITFEFTTSLKPNRN